MKLEISESGYQKRVDFDIKFHVASDRFIFVAGKRWYSICFGSKDPNIEKIILTEFFIVNFYYFVFLKVASLGTDIFKTSCVNYIIPRLQDHCGYKIHFVNMSQEDIKFIVTDIPI